jgi:hypothetical protein
MLSLAITLAPIVLSSSLEIRVLQERTTLLGAIVGLLIAMPSAGVFLHASVLLNRMPVIGHCRKRSFFSYQLARDFKSTES